MRTHPIDPTTHGVIDYTFAAVAAVGPAALGLDKRARTTGYALAGMATALSLFTDYPPSLKRVVPFRMHGVVETPFVPAVLAAPWLAGALRQRKAMLFFSSLFAVAATTYMLTDFNADEPDAPRPLWQRVFGRRSGQHALNGALPNRPAPSLPARL